MQMIHALGNELSFNKFHNPVRVFQKEIRELGLDVRFFSKPTELGIEDCDILLFYDDHYRDLLPIVNKDRLSALDFLSRFLGKFQRVIWFDGNDSSGWLRNYIFPLVDVYAKGHLVQSLSYYQEHHPTGMPHRDYVVENYHIDDPGKFKGPITEPDQQKLRISWNAAFKNWSWKNIPWYDGFIGKYHRRGYHFQYTAPNFSERSHLIPYRVNYWNNVPTVTWWRMQTRERIEEVILNHPPYQLNPPERVNRRQFKSELEKAIVTVSPFGLGEYAYRDYESFIYGSLLFKPDMSHQSTWPNFYMDGETYLSHCWDFSDFNEKLSAVLNHPTQYEEIARQGQTRFKMALSNGMAFAEHFVELIS